LAGREALCYNSRAVTRRLEPPPWVQQAGLLTSIPFVLLVGPALGYYLGLKLDQRWSFSPWGMLVGIVLGLLASARVTIQLIQEATRVKPHD